jgi:uncharacterized repeat protein (TIGR03847 family)
MPYQEIEIDPVTHITVDAIGKPGQRVFYIQARQDERFFTLLMEKIQIQTLAIGVDQFLLEVKEKNPDLSEASPDYEEDTMHILPPVDPLFRVGEVGLAYDTNRDRMILVLHEIQMGEIEPEKTGEEHPEEQGTVMRFWCTRSQLLAMCRWGLVVASRGRPLCPQCGEPMEPEGHFCPKKNGHKH